MKNVAAGFYASVSFANLCMLNLWHDNQRLQDPFVDYFRASGRDNTLGAGILAAVLLASVIFFAIQQAVNRLARGPILRAARSIFIAAFLFPCYLGLYVIVTSGWPPAAIAALKLCDFALMTAVVALVVSSVAFGADWPYRVAVTANRLAYPLPFILLVVGVLGHTAHASDFRTPTPPPHAPIRPPAARVLWLIFDEFGYTPAFHLRPNDLRLPHLDRLRRETLFATDAYAPANDTTLSMPALINGEVYSSTAIAGAGRLLLTKPGGIPRPWAARQTVFWDLTAAGVRTALVGWFHPYCRIFGNAVTDCTSIPATNTALLIREAYAGQIGVWRSASYLLRSQLKLLPLAPRGLAPGLIALGGAQQLTEYRQIHRAAMQYALSPSVGFLMVHYPIPHPYGIYDRTAEKLAASGHLTYLDNLALVDDTLGELRSGLEKAGLWDRTSLIVSADHPLRRWDRSLIGMNLTIGPRLHRVPFIIKLAGQNTGLEYAPRLNTVITKSLIHAISAREISTLDGLSSWLTASMTDHVLPEPRP